jgi:hypothetical protein
VVVLVAQLEVAEDDRDLCARDHENEQHEREEAEEAVPFDWDLEI